MADKVTPRDLTTELTTVVDFDSLVEIYNTTTLQNEKITIQNLLKIISGGVSVTGSLGSTIIDTTGIILTMTRAGTNILKANASGGKFGIFTDNRSSASDANANVIFNADQSTTFNGAVSLNEMITPTATADHGKVYTKTDNKLYFQDGAGTEHEIAFV